MVSSQDISLDSRSSPHSFPTELSPQVRTKNKPPRKSTTQTSKRKRDKEQDEEQDEVQDEGDSVKPAKPAKAAKTAKTAKTAKASEPDRKILVAIDFGTTFSGIAWTQTRKPECQLPIIQWPDASSGGLEGVSSDKVPSEIKYDGDDFKWGFQIEDSSQRQQWFKLDLDPSQLRTGSLASKYPDPRRAPPSYNKDAVRLTTDYLTALRKHAEQILHYQLPKSAMNSTPIEYIITIPAVWSHKAQAKTRACAERAGMGKGNALQVVSEPEAAAMYALDALDPHNIKIGDTFVLCDAGGGTVDLISFTVLALKPKLKIVEASPGSGDVCGASFLDRIFQDFIQRKLGKDRVLDEDTVEEAMKRFDLVIKRRFQGKDEEKFMVPVPGLCDDPGLAVRRGRLTVTGREIRDIFEPVVAEVLRLINGQIEATMKATMKPVKAVLLVGGFGQNAYLRDRISEAIGNVEVMQSPNGWTAVVRGALMKGLASTSPASAKVNIAGRSAREHYGLNVNTRFIAGTHERGRRYFHGYKGYHMILHMNWFTKKGDINKEDKPCRLKYQHLSPQSKGLASTINVDIYAFPDSDNLGAPQYMDDNNGVTKLATIPAELGRIPVHKLPTKRGADGKSWYVIDYEIQVTFCSAAIKFELFHKKTNYGAVTAEYA